MSKINYNLYPELTEIESFALNTEKEHTVYYEVCGNPQGYPVVFLHGGPGSGCNPTQRRFFDPSYYRIILIDQRGCGRSTPQGLVTDNTTADLVADIEAIRNALGIKEWLVFGGSWGSTLALSYALAHADKVSGLILRGIFLSRASELNWFLGDVSHFYPEAWQDLLNYLPSDAKGNVLKAYRDLVFNEDGNISIPAAARWNAYENAIMRLIPNIESEPAAPLTHAQGLIEVARARVQIHYIVNDCFVDGDAMLKAAHLLSDIPTTIVQGRYDMVCPPKSAWDLHQAMPHAQYQIVQDAGHSAMEIGITSALVAATEAFKVR